MPNADTGGGVVQTINFRDQFTDVADACALTQSIVDTVREPVLVLDKGLSDSEGTTVSITHATFWTKENRAA